MNSALIILNLLGATVAGGQIGRFDSMGWNLWNATFVALNTVCYIHGLLNSAHTI